MNRDERFKLESVLAPFSLRDVEVSMNIYLWLAYNNFLIEDLRENLGYIRNAKLRDRKNMIYTSVKNNMQFQELPYSFMKIFQRTLREIKSGKATVEDLTQIYKDERNRVLSKSKYGFVKSCHECKQLKKDWPMEVLW